MLDFYRFYFLCSKIEKNEYLFNSLFFYITLVGFILIISLNYIYLIAYGEMPYFDFLGKKITIGLFSIIIILLIYFFSPFYFKNFYFEPKKKAINRFSEIQKWNDAKIESKVFYNQGIKLGNFCSEYRSKKRFLKNEESKYSQNEICQENTENDINVDKVTFNKVFSAIYYSKNINYLDKNLQEAIYYVEH